VAVVVEVWVYWAKDQVESVDIHWMFIIKRVKAAEVDLVDVMAVLDIFPLLWGVAEAVALVEIMVAEQVSVGMPKLVELNMVVLAQCV
jgi:hypothetical protein